MTNQPPWGGPQDQQPGQPQPPQPGGQQPGGQQWQPPGQPWQPQPGQAPPWGQPWQPGGPQYQQPYPGGMPGGPVKPPRKRYRVRAVVLSVVGALVALVAISAALSAGHKPSNGSHNSRSSSSVVTQVSPSATATAPALTAAETKFYNDVQTRWPQIGGGTEAQIVSAGNQLCQARRAGASQQQVINASKQKFGAKSGAFVRNVERDLCPSEIPAASQVLLVMSGIGIRNSAPFTVSTSQVTVTYSFDCSALGQSGNFIADLNDSNQANYDDQSIANDLAASGGQTTTVYPQNQGDQYYVAVNSECSWTVKVVAD